MGKQPIFARARASRARNPVGRPGTAPAARARGDILPHRPAMAGLRWACCPCLPSPGPGRPAPAPVKGLLGLQEELKASILAWLPVRDLAVLGGAGRGLASRELAARGASDTLPLRVLHLLEAELLVFTWSGGRGRTATGEDGWATDFGSYTIGPKAPGDRVIGRYRWDLELVRHDGLLGVGIADRRMAENALLGSRSGGRWKAWGWDLDPRGGLERLCAEAAAAAPKIFPAAHLRPARGRRVVLGLHVDCTRGALELHARIRESPDGTWYWHFIDAMPFERPEYWASHGVAGLLDIRPVVSTDIGAVVLLLDQHDV